MFQFGWYPTNCYISLAATFTTDYPVKRDGLLHSETVGLLDYGSYPTSIAAICVLPRHERPGHSLSALIRLRRIKDPFLLLPIQTETLFLTRFYVLNYWDNPSVDYPLDATTHICFCTQRNFTFGVYSIRFVVKELQFANKM
jgi:hypothetical protein